uniref:Uncharacterized protein n=1 Tax=Rhizophora mucronata TaxID=61149 RepID=A0A2P2QNV2_RHIMU
MHYKWTEFSLESSSKIETQAKLNLVQNIKTRA